MNEYPRRRRVAPEEPPGGGGIPIFPLILVVIFAGLLLGGLIAHFSQKNDGTASAGMSPAPAVTPVTTGAPLAAVTPFSTPRARQTPSRVPSPTASVTPSAEPKTSASASAQVKPSQTPTAPPSVIIITPQPAITAEKSPPKVLETTTPPVLDRAGGPNISPNDASGVVHGYLTALARGDESSAASYLASGLPSEKFMTADAKITSIGSTKNSDGSFNVSADVQTASGEYFETFTVRSGANGLQITDHTAIKPQ